MTKVLTDTNGKVLMNAQGAAYEAPAGGGTTVEANPTVPSGTTPTDVKGLKIGNDYYDICAVHLDITNNDIDSAINTAWV